MSPSCAVGAVIFVVAAKVDAARLEKFAWPLMIFALVLTPVS